MNLEDHDWQLLGHIETRGDKIRWFCRKCLNIHPYWCKPRPDELVELPPFDDTTQKGNCGEYITKAVHGS